MLKQENSQEAEQYFTTKVDPVITVKVLGSQGGQLLENGGQG